MTTHPDTSLAAYDATDDVSLRHQVARVLRERPMTTNELTQRLDHSANAVRPRINELIRMGCVERDGKRENPSGHMAYTNRLTPAGERYLEGEIVPEPGPPLAALKGEVVATTRGFLTGEVDRTALALAVMRYDEMAGRMDPEGEA